MRAVRDMGGLAEALSRGEIHAERVTRALMGDAMANFPDTRETVVKALKEKVPELVEKVEEDAGGS